MKTGLSRAAARDLLVVAWLAGLLVPAAPANAGSPTSGGGHVVLEPVPAPRSPRRQRTVFVCERDATPVFSDRPCGPAMETLELDFTEPGPGRAASTLAAAPGAATRPLVQRAEHDVGPPPADDRCAELERHLEALDDRMRAGYSARESARLWSRWRDLKAQIHTSRC